MKKRVHSVIAVLVLVSIMLPFCRTAYADTPDSEEYPALQYSYEVTPILSPFCYAIYVKTDNPDVTGLRFVDKSIAVNDGQLSSSFIPCKRLFADVAYENEETFRVNGGYIFLYDNHAVIPDGGELALQVIQKGREDYALAATGSSSISYSTYVERYYLDTGITVDCPALMDYQDYLITNYTDPSAGLFENLDSVQKALTDLSVYPKYVFDTNKPNSSRPYPLLAASPYAELGLNEHYEIYGVYADGSLLTYIYPFILDSASFPGTMWNIAETLQPDCTVENTGLHWMVDVTYNGETKSYGGAGTGSTNDIYLNDIRTLFTFQNGNGDYASLMPLHEMREELIRLGKAGDAAVETLQDQIAGETFRQTIGGGSWIRAAREGWFGFGEIMAYIIPSSWGNVYPVSGAWVDGRYLNQYESWEVGAKFSDYPNADIVLTDMTYTNRNGETKTGAVLYRYNADNDNWSARSYYTSYSNDNVPDMFYMTREQVEALVPDRNTNTIPTDGMIYDGTAEPGSRFHNTPVTGIILDQKEIEVDKGGNVRLHAVIEPSDATYQDINWTGSDDSVISLGESTDGKECVVYGIEAGTATVTAMSLEGRKIAECKVTVVTHTPSEAVRENEVLPTCTTSGSYDEVIYCSDCGKEISRKTVSLEALGHNLVKTEANDATCTEAGNTEYYTCGRCNKLYSDENGIKEINLSDTVVAAKGHTAGNTVEEHKVEATCTENGSHDEVIYCTVCNTELDRVTKTDAALGHDWGEWTVVREATEEEEGLEERVCTHDKTHKETRVIPKKEHVHVLEKVEMKDATCTEAGNTEYYICGKCQKLYSDKDGSKEINLSDTVVAAKGHTEGETVEENKVAATCSENGSHDEVIYCTVCNTELSRVTKTDAVLGHDWGEWTVVREATEEEEGLEERTCTRDETHKETRVIPKKDHVHIIEKVEMKDSTCAEPGNIEYYICTGCGHIFKDENGSEETDSENIIIPMKDHQAGDTEIENSVDATCEEPGSYDEVTRCAVCGTELIREKKTIAALGHTEVIDEASAPTCENSGLTEGSHCSVCGKTIKAQGEIPATGHDWGEWKVITEATYTSEGLECRYCKNDESHVEEHVTAKIVPEYVITLDKTAASLVYGKTFTLKATVTPADAPKPTITWISSNKSIATVKSSGIVTAKGVGTATITASLPDGTKATCKVTVNKAASTITLKARTASYNGSPININPATVKGSKGKITYTYYTDSKCTKKASVHKNARTYYVKATVAADNNYKAATSKAVKLIVNKAANPIIAKAKTGLTASAKTNTTITKAKAFTISKAQGTVTFKKTKGDAKITVASNGNVTVKKGLRKGTTYPVTVKVTVAGNKNYKAKSRTVTLKIKII